MIEQRLAAAVEQALAQAGAVARRRRMGSVCHRAATLGKSGAPCNAALCRARNGRRRERLKDAMVAERDDQEAAESAPVRGSAPAHAASGAATQWIAARLPRAAILVAVAGGVGGAQADRQQCRRQRAGEARGAGDLHARPHRASHPAGQQPRHRRSRQSRPHRAGRAGPDADQVERQRRSLSHRRARRAAQGPGGRQQGQLGPDRQIASAAERQAVHLAQHRRRCRRHDDRARARRYGPLGFALQGRGNLAGGFKGKLAAVGAAARAGRVPARAVARLSSRSRWSRGARTSSARSAPSAFACPASRLALAEPRMEIDSSFSEAFGSFDGKGRLSMASLVAGVNGLAAVNSNLTFKGTPTDIAGRIDLSARQARLANILADRTRIDGRYRLDARRGALTLVGDYGASSVALAPSMTRRASPGRWRRPRARRSSRSRAAMARAISGAARNFDVDGSLRLVNRRGGGGVRIETARARSRSGARDRRLGRRRGDLLLAERADPHRRRYRRCSGGGLPTARITLRQPRSGAPMSGTAPNRALCRGRGADRACAGAVRRAARRLDPGVDRRAARRAVRRRAGDRAARADRRAVRRRAAAWCSARAASTRASPRCSSARCGSARRGCRCARPGRRSSTAAPGARCGSGVATRNIKLRGRLGSSPFALDAAQRADARPARVRGGGARRFGLARADSPVLINAEHAAAGLSRAAGISGKFAGADGKIGRVPLDMSRRVGQMALLQ